ncbi:telomere repeats-binding bouquet formation protein 2 [Scleropages formosus]|uniref:telomere repeats-binding bouquet formation protein 2 n=1 Tax=Scleropages formosus TaxID=113540 RepID=UPI0010FAC0FC|nr:telomere repeats-binding bouquet formation protein 2 [Scleropages formosus]
MFRGKSAWFSKSVNEDLRRLWVSEGGETASCTTADYLFSQDASCPDTRRIYESADYSEGKVSVFHSSYVSACGRGQNGASVAIGHYVLPPACVQQEVKAALGSFVWEQEEQHKAVEEDNRETRKETNISPEELGIETSKRGPFTCCNTQHYPVNNMITGYVSADELRKYSGELHDFLPGHLGFSVTKAPCEK